MTDYFALLSEPRQPWLDTNQLKHKFLALSADVHPDRVHGAGEAEKKSANERYTQLNAAYQCLRNPRDRVRHLLELELGRKPEDLDRVPDELVDSFMAVAQALCEADRFLAEKEKATSPMLQVQFVERGQAFVEELEAPAAKISAARENLLTRLREMSGPNLDLDRLEEIYRLLGYHDRWLKQIQERRVRLSL